MRHGGPHMNRQFSAVGAYRVRGCREIGARTRSAALALSCRIGIRYRIRYNGVMPQQPMRKGPVMLPKDLVERATKPSGVGLTPTLPNALQSRLPAPAY